MRLINYLDLATTGIVCDQTRLTIGRTLEDPREFFCSIFYHQTIWLTYWPLATQDYMNC